MKRLFIIFVMLAGSLQAYSQAAKLIVSQSKPYQHINTDNLLYVDTADMRIWAVSKSSIMINPAQVTWLNDSVLVIARKKFVSKDSIYNNPSWIGSLDYGSKIVNKPNLSSYETVSHASATYQPIGSYYPLTGNPSAFLTSITSSQINSALGYTPYNSTNPSGYISSVPAQSFTSLTGKPTTLSGYGITDAVPNTRTITINGTTFDLSANRSYTVGDVTSASLSSTLANYVLTSTYTAGLATKQNSLTLTTTGSGASTLVGSTLNIPTPVINTYTAGTGINIASNVISNTAPDQTVVITGSNGITTGGTYPSFSVQQTTPTYNNAPARTLGTSFRPSTTRPTRASYTVSITTAISLLNLNSSGSVALQISADNISFSTINTAGITRALAVSISVGLNDTSMFNIQGEIPAGYYCRLQSTLSGGATATFTSGQEVTY